MKKIALILAAALLLGPAQAQYGVPGAGSGGVPVGAGGASGTAGGDLSGTYPNPTVAKVNGATLGTASAQNYTATTWTPTITTTGTVGTPVYTNQVGSYEQIGRLVVARFTITLSSWGGTPTGNVQIGGLPVAAGNTANDFGTCYISNYAVTGLAASSFGIVGFISPNTSVAALQQNGNTSTTNITAAQAGATAQFIGACIYHS